MPESGGGATGYDVKPGAGLKLNKARVPYETVRRDGMTKRDRHGSRSSGVTYGFELGVDLVDDLIEAAFRGTVVAQATIDEAAMTSITTTTSTIVAAAGSWLTQGVRRGDMVKLANHATAGNNGKWLRVLSVTATTITVPANSLTLNAVADTEFELIVAKTVVQGEVPVERYHTVEEYLQDIDQSKLGTDMKISKMTFSAQPNKNIEVTFTFMGRDMVPKDAGDSPVLTGPTYTATLPLVMVDGIIRIGGVDYSVLTGFSFELDMGGEVTPTLSRTSPDVFLGNAKLSGSFSALRQDLAFLQAFDAETPIEFLVLCAENEADPADFIAFYIGDATISDNSDAIASEGGMTETTPWSAGKDEGGSDRAPTMIKMCTSAT